MPSHVQRNIANSNFAWALTSNVLGVLTEVIKPDHLMNPWPEVVRFRNCMVIMILIGLGIRSRELLNLRIHDLDFKHRKAVIRCGNERLLLLLMPEHLATIMREYIAIDRQKYPGSKEHDFLLVSSKDGYPLSPSAFKHIFTAVRRNVPGIPADFNARYCRHTAAALQDYYRSIVNPIFLTKI